MRSVADQRSHPDVVAALLEIVPQVAYFIDAQGIVQYVNRAGRDQPETGLPVGTDLATHPVTTHLYDSKGNLVAPEAAPFYRSLRGETCRNVELIIRQPGGPPRTVRVSSTPVQQDGVIIGVALVADRLTGDGPFEHDLAERNQALQALNALAARLLRINRTPEVYETALDGILAIMGATQGGIALADDGRREFRTTLTRGYSEATRRTADHLSYDTPSAHNMVRETGEIIIAHPDQTTALGQAVLAREAMQTGVLLPLFCDERVVGVLSYLLEEHRECTPLEREILRTAATYVGAALERVQLYEQAEAEHTRLARILEQLPVGVFIAEGETAARSFRWNLINRAGQEQFAVNGAGQEPFIPTLVRPGPDTGRIKILHPDGRPFAEDELPLQQIIWTGKQAVERELILRYKDGSERVFLSIIRLLRESNGTREAVAVSQDITERKRLEEALRRQAEATEAERARLAHIFEQLPVGIFIAEGEAAERTMRWNFINPAAQRQLQAPAVTPGVISETFTVQHPDGRPYAEDELPIQRTLWTGRPVVQQEMVFRYHSGEERIFASTTAVLRDERGTREVIEVLQDITPRHQAEAALRRSEERFAHAFHANPDPLHITRMADAHILDVNERWVEMTGYRREEVVGRTVLELGLWVEPAARDRITQLLRAHGAVRNHEAAFRMKNGDIRECLISVELIETGGEPCALSMVHDVTEHKRLEEQVRRQAEAIQVEYKRLAAVIAHVDVALALVDARGRIQVVNDSWEGLNGYTRDQALGRRYAEVVDSPTGRRLQAQIDQVLATGEPVRAHETLVQDTVHPYGIYLDWTIQPIRSTGGAVTGALSVAVDVTEKVRTRRQIEEQRTLLETIFESTPIGIILFDREMRVLDLNAEYARMTHLDPPAVRGRRLYDLTPSTRDRTDLHARVLAGEVIDQDSVPYPDPDGTIHYYDILYRPVRGVGGTVTGILSAANDVTEKVRNREEIEDQRALLETIIATTPVGIAFYDPQLRVANLNATWARMIGVDMAAARGQPLYKAAPALREREAVHRRVLNGEAVDLTNVPYDLPGETEPRYYDLSFRPVRDADGEITGILVAGVDVTARHELDRQKDDFIALASHELKTPITAIKGYAQTGLRVVGQLGDERLIRMLRIIDDQSNRLTRLINDLLDVSRMESGALTFYYEPFDLRRLVHEVVNNLELTAPDFTITEHLPTIPTPVNADRQRLEQVVTNLVQNAIKYSGAGRRIEVTMTHAGGEVITAVRDSGVGIPAEQQARVFERFFRGSNVSSRHYSGLGLGLFISHGIVARHGGRMWLESAEGQGSAFYFSLPLLSNE